MKRIRLTVPVIAIMLALIPSSALAGTTTYQESVAGVETGFPQTIAPCPVQNGVSSFAGIAHGDLNGIFHIAVCHTELHASATILGGTFVISNGTNSVSGTFANGSVSAAKPIVIGSGCIQRYDVSGDLSPSPGHFKGKLVHYGVWTGSCNAFFATISGSALLTG